MHIGMDLESEAPFRMRCECLVEDKELEQRERLQWGIYSRHTISHAGLSHQSNGDMSLSDPTNQSHNNHIWQTPAAILFMHIFQTPPLVC